MSKRICLMVLLFTVALVGCADRQYLQVRMNHDVERIFQQGEMLEDYNYYYNGPKNEPIALLALDKRYQLNSEFWTPFDESDGRFQWWLDLFKRLNGDYDDIAYIRIDYRGNEILSENRERIGLVYSRYDWIVTWRGEGNELYIPPPRPSSSQHPPTMIRRGML